MTCRARATGSSLPRECITVIFMKTVTINSCGELVTAGHGTRGIGFKYGKMKGLKISPPQSVARIDHTSFLCANEASLPYPSAYLSTIRSLSYPSPSPPAILPILLFRRASPSSIYPYEHLRPVRATCHSSSSPSAARAVYVRAFSSVCEPPWKRGIYEIPVKTLLSGLSVRLRRVPGRTGTCKRFRPVSKDDAS